MKLLVFLIQFIFLKVEVNCLQIISCIHNGTIYTSLQNEPIIVGCETDQTLLGCKLRHSHRSNKYCIYWYGKIWKDCPPETISSSWKRYSSCEFVISNPSVTGK